MRRLAPAVPLAVLIAYGAAVAASSLGSGPIGVDDHPGQLYRVWHVVRHGFAPWAWNEGWWAGYPELQFYPPGFAFLGGLLHLGSLGLIPVTAAYQALVWAAYLAPGLTVYALLARLLGHGWYALPGALVALTLAAGPASGVEGGVRWGMVAARLAWALLPLLLLCLVRWCEEADPPPWSAAGWLAAIVLLHPAHLPAAAAIVGLAAAVGPDRMGRRLAHALALMALAAGLTAFWTLPLLARLGESRALAWGSLATVTLPALRAPLPWVLVGLSVLAPRLAPRVEAPPGTAGAARVVAWLPWVTVLAVVADALIAEPAGIRWLPADRIADGAWLAVVLAAGLAAGSLLRRATGRWHIPAALGALAAVLAAAALAVPGGSLMLWPRASDWPAASVIERGLRLGALWAALREAPPGRILFIRSAVPLVHGEAWYRPHTHVTALAPVVTGRAIVGGTFTHPSPVAALLYRGDAGPGPIRTLAERLDGRTLFGRDLGALDGRTLAAFTDPLGISTLVGLDDDVPALRALGESGDFAPRPSAPPFVILTRAGSGFALPARVGPGRWRVVLDGEAGTWASARLAYYPLWRAEQSGTAVPVRRGSHGQLEVRLARAGAPVDLWYAPGLPEGAGVLASAGAAALWGILVLGGRPLREARARPAPAGDPTRAGRS